MIFSLTHVCYAFSEWWSCFVGIRLEIKHVFTSYMRTSIDHISMFCVALPSCEILHFAPSTHIAEYNTTCTPSAKFKTCKSPWVSLHGLCHSEMGSSEASAAAELFIPKVCKFQHFFLQIFQLPQLVFRDSGSLAEGAERRWYSSFPFQFLLHF